MRHATRLAVLVGLWLLAWGDLSVANVVSGLVVASALLVAFPLPRVSSSVRLNAFGLARLASYVARQLVVSNVVMTRQILRRRAQNHPGVLAHTLTQPSDEVLTLMTSIISLSPGTMTVDVADDATVVYVHFFDLRDIEGARRGLSHLELLSRNAVSPKRRIQSEGTVA